MKKLTIFSILFLLIAFTSAGEIHLPPLAGWITFSYPIQSLEMRLNVNNSQSAEAYTVATTFGGEACRKIPAGKFMYVGINRSAVATSEKNIILSITYFDNSMNNIWLNYTRSGKEWGIADFPKSNTKKWITRLIVLSDAGLNGTMNGNCDIRMGFNNEDNYIKDISIYVGELKPDQEIVPETVYDPNSEFVGRSFAGYQLWHQAGEKAQDWKHWSYDIVPSAGRGNHNIETFPMISDYMNNPEIAMYKTNYAPLGDGTETRLYNSTDKGVIDVQMGILKKAGFDGVAIQLNAPVGKTLKNTTEDYIFNIKKACEANGRLFYMMYCMPDQNNGDNMSATLVEGIKRDWVYQMEQIYELTKSSAYATVNGKPVVELWGLGYSTIMVDKVQALELAAFFKSRGCFVVAGVPRDWRLMNEGSRPDFQEVYTAYDMVSPWTVGAYNNAEGATNYLSKYLQPDKAYCDANDIGYYPVIFPGSAWSQHVHGYPNDTPRKGGQFLWTQAKNIRSIGAKSMYFAMLDEFEESTNIISSAVDYFDIPTDQYFGTQSMDGIWTSSNFYLRLAGAAARMLTSDEVVEEIPIPYSEGPVYYRNSFESRTANCSIDNVLRDIVMPIDPCFYKKELISKQSVTSPSISIVKDNNYAKSGDYGVKISGTGSGSASFYYKISETRIDVKEQMQLSFWRFAVNEAGLNTTVDLRFKSGKMLHNLAGYADQFGNPIGPAVVRGTTGQWENFVCEIGKGELVGDVITDIIIAYEQQNANGAFTAWFDNVVLSDSGYLLVSVTEISEDIDKVKVFYRKGELVLNGVDNASTVTVFNLMGQPVFKATSENSRIELMLEKGIYLVIVEKGLKRLCERFVVQ